MYYMLVKVIGGGKANYFIKSKKPIRNQKDMLKGLTEKYKDKEFEADKLLGKSATVLQYYLLIVLNKILN